MKVEELLLWLKRKRKQDKLFYYDFEFAYYYELDETYLKCESELQKNKYGEYQEKKK